ncbi:hypothetical protein UFOVP594_5 [uncultured Caudovirales phage]|uniref:Uncharacterized protein n=1 Tax=uncultured Caudovirales phage TaxID=2100421 RepID=A0A6J5MZJ3_9CAUD|nr:hypothetical protein UFOVP594_5 [uncultured Caudovirales phage]
MNHEIRKNIHEFAGDDLALYRAGDFLTKMVINLFVAYDMHDTKKISGLLRAVADDWERDH